MADIDPYIRTLFFQKHGKLPVSSSPLRRPELVPQFTEQVDSLLNEYGFANITDVDLFVDHLVNELIDVEVIRQEDAGEYLTFDNLRYTNYRNNVLVNDDIYKVSQRIGPRFFADVFNGFANSLSERSSDFPLLGLAPASSRIVTFSDNQIANLDEETSRVIDAVTAQNQIGDVAGLRELLLGQLKAGRELIRAGSFRLYFFQLTVLQSLRFLSERYEKEVIGGLAAALITALVKQIGVDA